MPSTLGEVNFLLFAHQLMTSEGLNFLVADSGPEDPLRVALFATEKGLKQLSEAKQLHTDGTFDTTPDPFYQLVTIHAVVGNRQFPVAYFLLPKKNSSTYDKAFEMLKNALTSRGLRTPSAGTTFVSDFEAGLLASLRRAFPQASFLGCFFHYAQCIWRQVQRRGWATKYELAQTHHCGHFCGPSRRLPMRPTLESYFWKGEPCQGREGRPSSTKRPTRRFWASARNSMKCHCSNLFKLCPIILPNPPKLLVWPTSRSLGLELFVFVLNTFYADEFFSLVGSLIRRVE